MKKKLEFEDLGMKISVPYNHDMGILEVIEKFKEHIYSVYLPCPPRLMFSGDVTQKVDWEAYEKEIFVLQKELGKWGIQLNMLYNVTSFFNPKVLANFAGSEIYAFTKKLMDNGVKDFVVADIALAKKLRESFSDIRIEVSLNAFVKTVKQAILWVDEVSPETICVAEDMNKDLEFIKSLKKVTGKKLKMLVNSRCQGDCPNAICHANLLSVGYPSSLYMCGTVIARKPWLMYRGNAVVPYNLRHYVGLMDYVKLIGRTQPSYIIERDLELYVNNCNSRSYSLNNGVINEAYGHYDDLGEYIKRGIKHPYLKEEPADVFGKVTSCRRDCQECSWCFERWREDWGVNEEIDPGEGIGYEYLDLF